MNLANFRKSSTFQSGVISFIANIQAKSSELEDLRKMFLKLDTSKDGILDKDEIQNGMTEIMEMFHIDQEDWDKIIGAMDTDGDGKIDYTEFITAAFNRELLLSQQNLNAAFKIFDADGNGVIDLSELKAVFARGNASGKTEDVWKEIMESADANKDGVIDFAEFEKSMLDVLKHRATFMAQANK